MCEGLKGRTLRAWLMGGAAALASLAGPVLARGAEPSGQSQAPVLEEVVVTANKREQNIQNVPMSITAISGGALERLGAANFQDYATQVPNLSFSVTGVSPGRQLGMVIRGIAGGAGFYLDEIALPAGIDPRIVDIERVEVLRGPQGTLYGASAMSGTVRLVTNQPSTTAFTGQTHVIGSATEGGGLNGAVDGGVNIPVIADRLAIKVLGYYDYESGTYDRYASQDPVYGAPVPFAPHKNVDSQFRNGGQVAATLKLFDGDLTITPRFMFGDAASHGQSVADFRPGNTRQERMFDYDSGGHDAWRLYTLTATYSMPFGDLVSASSQFDRRADEHEDFSELFVAQGFPSILGVNLSQAIPITSTSKARINSQELRFVSRLKAPIQFTVGAYYRKSNTSSNYPPIMFDGFNIYSAGIAASTTEQALFGEATWQVTDALSVTGGLRYFDTRTANGGFENGDFTGLSNFSGKSHETGLNPKYVAEYRLTRDAQIYAMAAKGFRTGGGNTFSKPGCAADIARAGLTGADLDSYKSDTLWNYEGGAKTTWLDGRLQVNGALFHIVQTGLQQSIEFPTCGQNAVVNVGEAQSDGGELEVNAVVSQGLRLSFGTGYTDARITAGGKIGNYVVPVPVGQRTQQVPRWNVSAGLDYNFQVGRFPSFAHADYAYVGSSRGVTAERDAYHMVNLRAGTDLGRVQLAFFVKNAFDVSANLSDVLGVAPTFRTQFSVSRPRTIGIDATAKF